MKLTRTERWIISNQLRILAFLDKEEQEYYEQCQKIIEDGYELLYNDCAQHILPDDDTFSVEKSKQVIDILDMFRGINNCLLKLEDKSDLDFYYLQFHGFDGNYETEYMVFAEFFCKEFDGGRFSDVVEGLESFNSHSHTLDSYLRMLEVWKSCPNKFELTKDDLIRIQVATNYPSKR